MAKFAHSEVLDGGPLFIKNNCTKLCVVDAYTFGDSYATVSSNILAEAAMSSSDFTLSNSGNNRILTTASGKSDSSANATGNASHLAFLDTINARVLWVTEELTGMLVTAGQTISFPVLVYTSTQPVAA